MNVKYNEFFYLACKALYYYTHDSNNGVGMGNKYYAQGSCQKEVVLFPPVLLSTSNKRWQHF